MTQIKFCARSLSLSLKKNITVIAQSGSHEKKDFSGVLKLLRILEERLQRIGLDAGSIAAYIYGPRRGPWVKGQRVGASDWANC